jgi:hypothetical protein
MKSWLKIMHEEQSAVTMKGKNNENFQGKAR